MIYLFAFIVITVIVLFYIVHYAVGKIVNDKIQSEYECLKLLKEREVYDIKKYNSDDFENVTIISHDNLKLCGYYYKNSYNEHSDKALIFVHGYSSNHVIGLQFLSLFENMDFNVLFVDMRRHGKSEGEYSTYGYFEKYDIGLWVDYIKSKIGENLVIGLMGLSMGAASVLQYGGLNPPIDFIISDCTYNNPCEIIMNSFRKANVPILPIYRFSIYYIKFVCGFDIENINVSERLKGNEIPTLFIHGDTDKTIPYTMSIDIFNTKNCSADEICIFEGADHVESFASDKEKYKNAIEHFFEKLGIIL